MNPPPLHTRRLNLSRPVLLLSAAALLSACSSMGNPSSTAMAFRQDALPDAIKVPEGHKVALETVGVGEITYECRDKANAPGQVDWAFVGPSATLNDRGGKALGSYFGPPATWAATDGSKITGTQVAVAPSGEGNLPFQLVKANPATGSGLMTGVTFVQRVALKGGVAPAAECGAANKGARQTVRYQADYIFWKAA
jgi:Protein of unknown function (DUF3455)